MKVNIKHQESYSRKQLLLRSFFGWLYIVIPHSIAYGIYAFYVSFHMFFAWVIVMLGGTYPRATYERVIKLTDWQFRLSASLINMVDGYPPLGPNSHWDKANISIGYPEILTRKRLLYSTFVAPILLMPHIFYFYAYSIKAFVYAFLSWFNILFDKEFKSHRHQYLVDYNRYMYRLTFYVLGFYFVYPSFDKEESEVDKIH